MHAPKLPMQRYRQPPMPTGSIVDPVRSDKKIRPARASAASPCESTAAAGLLVKAAQYRIDTERLVFGHGSGCRFDRFSVVMEYVPETSEKNFHFVFQGNWYRVKHAEDNAAIDKPFILFILLH